MYCIDVSALPVHVGSHLEEQTNDLGQDPAVARHQQLRISII